MQKEEMQRRRHLLYLCGWAALLAVASTVIAEVLLVGIDLSTNIFYFQRLSFEPAAPNGQHLGIFAVFVPMLGGLIVGLMARYGSPAIRGHGIPEAMEKILVGESRIPRRMTVLKPL